MTKSLIRISKALRCVFPSRKYTVTAKLHYSNQQFNEVIKTVGDEDKHTKAIRDLKADDINLKLLKIDNKIDYNYAMRSLKKLQTFYKENGIPLSDLRKDETFLKIASAVNHQFMHLDVNEVINLIKIFNLMEVSSSSILMQSLLQSIRLSINRLDLREIYFLTLLLNKMEVTHLGEAIKLALVEVFKAQVELQLDMDNQKEIILALIYGFSYVNDKAVLECLIEIYDDNAPAIDLDTAVTLLLKLINLKAIPYNFTQIFNTMSNIVMDKLMLLDKNTILKIFFDLCNRISSGHNEVYNPMLIDSLVKISVDKNFGLKLWLQILNLLIKIRHVNKPLLDRLLQNFHEFPSVFLECHPTSYSLIMSGLACANYRPPVWNDVQDLFISSIRESDNKSLLSFAIDLAALDYYNSDLLRKIFTNCNTVQFLSNKSCRHLNKLYHSVRILHPEYVGPWPSDSTMKLINSQQISNESQSINMPQLDKSLLASLEQVLGGPAYIKNNVIINEVKESIDHLILLENKCPIDVESIVRVSSNTSKSFYNIEDFDIPSTSERVAVILIKSEACSRNVPTMDSLDLLRIKILKGLSYNVIPIFQNTWISLPYHKRSLYLQSLIKVQNDKSVRIGSRQ